jgi:heme/copper-type cytochrome/quinol oxidase subunit 2
MIVKLRKERKTIWHIFIVLMMMLVIVFLVAPASAINCAPKYTANVKVIDSVGTDEKDVLVLTYRIPVVPVVTLRVYVEKERTVTNWHYERTSTPRTWCTVNRRCEVSGDPVVIPGRTGVTYGPWRSTGYYTTET